MLAKLWFVFGHNLVISYLFSKEKMKGKKIEFFYLGLIV